MLSLFLWKNASNCCLIYNDLTLEYRERFGCACAYFLFGIMCLDRFTARAFLADDDQVAAAVSATAIRDPARKDSYDSYEDGARHNSFSNNGTYSPNRAYSEERDRGQYEM